jgi:hypothetical protein
VRACSKIFMPNLFFVHVLENRRALLVRDCMTRIASKDYFVLHPILIKFAPVASSPLNNLFESEALVLVLFPVAHLAILKPASSSRNFLWILKCKH